MQTKMRTKMRPVEAQSWEGARGCEKCRNGITKSPRMDGEFWKNKPAGITSMRYLASQSELCDCDSGDNWRKYLTVTDYRQQDEIAKSRLDHIRSRTKQIFMHRDGQYGFTGVPPGWAGYTLSGFVELAKHDEGKTSLIEACLRLHRDGVITMADGDRQGIFAYGNSGVGKTGALTPLFGVLARGKSSLWIAYLNLLDSLRDYKSDLTAERMGKLCSVDVLMIDELGNPNGETTEFVRTSIFQIIKHRHENRLTTLITSNLLPDNMRTMFDERMWRRLFQLCAGVRVTGAPIGGVITDVEF